MTSRFIGLRVYIILFLTTYILYLVNCKYIRHINKQITYMLDYLKSIDIKVNDVKDVKT